MKTKKLVKTVSPSKHVETKLDNISSNIISQGSKVSIACWPAASSSSSASFSCYLQNLSASSVSLQVSQ